MKVGIRKRSYNKSFSAMTSGRYKRAMKRAVNPFYGRKGIGFLKNPSKSIRNMMYHRLTIGTAPSDINRLLTKRRKNVQKTHRKTTSHVARQKGLTRTFISSYKKQQDEVRAEQLRKEQERNAAREYMETKYHLPLNNSISGAGAEKIWETESPAEPQNTKRAISQAETVTVKESNQSEDKPKNNITQDQDSTQSSTSSQRSWMLLVASCLLLVALFMSIANTGSNRENYQIYGEASDDGANATTTNSNQIDQDKTGAIEGESSGSTNEQQVHEVIQPDDKNVSSSNTAVNNYVGQYKETNPAYYREAEIWTFNEDNSATYTGNKDVPYTISKDDNQCGYKAKSYYMAWLLCFSEDWMTLKAVNDYNGSMIEFKRI